MKNSIIISCALLFNTASGMIHSFDSDELQFSFEEHSSEEAIIRENLNILQIYDHQQDPSIMISRRDVIEILFQARLLILKINDNDFSKDAVLQNSPLGKSALNEEFVKQQYLDAHLSQSVCNRYIAHTHQHAQQLFDASAHNDTLKKSILINYQMKIIESTRRLLEFTSLSPEIITGILKSIRSDRKNFYFGDHNAELLNLAQKLYHQDTTINFYCYQRFTVIMMLIDRYIYQNTNEYDKKFVINEINELINSYDEIAQFDLTRPLSNA